MPNVQKPLLGYSEKTDSTEVEMEMEPGPDASRPGSHGSTKKGVVMQDYSSIPPRYLSKFHVDIPTGCWLWTAATIQKGYGQFWYDGKLQYAHRIAYELLVGPIPNGLQLDHLCRVRNCVNPEHLEPVTNQENCRRGETGAHNGIKTHCPHGHPYDEINTYRHRGERRCKGCRRIHNMEYYQRRKLAAIGEV